jgi:hypothetical protein
MKEFDVYGQAHGTVSVEYKILAESEKEAKTKASKLFQTGTIGSVKYLDDDEAVNIVYIQWPS